MTMDTPLTQGRCRPCHGGVPALDAADADALLAQLPAWTRDDNVIVRRYTFRSYAEVMAFANAVAWVALREDHHPDLTVGHDYCIVRYTTHAIGGLSENDFICAAKIDQVFAL